MTTPSEDYRTILLTKEKATLIDAADYEWLAAWKWCADSCGDRCYAARQVTVGPHRYVKMRMHRVIMGLDAGDRRLVDHINHNTLDNRRTNLRIVTASQNNQNMFGRNSLKGAYYFKRTGRWISAISTGQKNLHLGYFDSEIEAHEAYKKAALQYFGDFACIESRHF